MLSILLNTGDMATTDEGASLYSLVIFALVASLFVMAIALSKNKDEKTGNRRHS